jgi:hypothetical protein
VIDGYNELGERLCCENFKSFLPVGAVDMPSCVEPEEAGE